MNIQVKPHITVAERRLPFECVALVLQGGGALGSYQAGFYQALAEANIHPDWIAGISIGAINAAIIAGNPPPAHVDRLRDFWTQVTTDPVWPYSGCPGAARGDAVRNLLNQMSAGLALASGARGFFTTRPVSPWLQPAGTIEATSFYDTGDLKRTLERLVDLDRLNADAIRFSVGAVNVRTGNFVYFDMTTHTIRPEHVMASGALPPGFPAIEIEGEHYWDGGLVSNTPLQCAGVVARRSSLYASHQANPIAGGRIQPARPRSRACPVAAKADRQFAASNRVLVRPINKTSV
jgi:NTE family protein